jgi:hypothetical protein
VAVTACPQEKVDQKSTIEKVPYPAFRRQRGLLHSRKVAALPRFNEGLPNQSVISRGGSRNHCGLYSVTLAPCLRMRARYSSARLVDQVALPLDELGSLWT